MKLFTPGPIAMDPGLPQETFLIPHESEKLMRNLYGYTWKTPIKDIASRHSMSERFKRLLKNPTRLFFYVNRFFKKKIRVFREDLKYKNE